MKTFTLDEANALLPVLESLLRVAIEGKQKLDEMQKDAQQVAHHVFLSGGSLLNISDMIAKKAERESLMNSVRDTLAEIDATGVQVKDLEIGLLDFPCEVAGEIILLCWKLGETSITHWHTVEAGFKGRRPIDDRIPKANKPN